MSPYVLIADALVAMIWAELLEKRSVMKKMTVKRSVSSTRVFVRERITVTYRIVNESGKTIEVICIPSTGLPNASKREIKLRLEPHKPIEEVLSGQYYTRGKKWIGSATFYYEGPFGFFGIWKSCAFEEEILVFPYFEEVVFEKEVLRLLLPGRKTAYRLLEDATKVRNTRDYVDEPLNRMNWKLSARYGKLMTKDFETTALGRVHLVVDMNMPEGVVVNDAWKHMRERYEEQVVSGAGSVLKELKKTGTAVRLSIIGEQIWEADYPGTEFVLYLESLVRANGVEKPTVRTAEVLTRYAHRASLDETIVFIAMHLTENEIPLLLRLRARCAKVIVWLMPYGYRPCAYHRSRSYEMPHPEAAKVLEYAKTLEENRIIVKFFLDNDALQEVIDRVP
ncbi:MAG TPA: DUF58 domain-containing protein [Thermotogota bacterium]|nr:DUF58 domain-containing protein [Thermotogota bacterium]